MKYIYPDKLSRKVDGLRISRMACIISNPRVPVNNQSWIIYMHPDVFRRRSCIIASPYISEVFPQWSHIRTWSARPCAARPIAHCCGRSSLCTIFLFVNFCHIKKPSITARHNFHRLVGGYFGIITKQLFRKSATTLDGSLLTMDTYLCMWKICS